MTRGAPASVAAGTRIGPYEIVGWLGSGGMGDVYRARDPRLAREVAVKVIAETFATDAARVHRFEQEARAAGQLNHPNILAVFDVGVHAGTPYLVSELLEGESLSRRLAPAAAATRESASRGAAASGGGAPRAPRNGGPLPWRKAVDHARQAAEGLAAAHDRGIVHRDVKPDNLFLTNDGRVKILDFGIAKLTRSSDDGAPRVGATDTAVGLVVGTAGYMSPEQVRGDAVDGRSDIFSLGTILYEMLSGRPAFTRASTVETMAAILKEDPPAPLPPTVPPAVERIVSRCLEKTRETRFQSARDLAFALEGVSGTTATGAKAPLVAALRRWRTALGSAVVVLSIFGVLAGWLTRSTPPPPIDNPLAGAVFSRVTNWAGTEEHAEISPDGKFVAFLADRAGQLDVWVTQLGTGKFDNLTLDIPPMLTPGNLLRSLGFSGDGSEIWFSPSGNPGREKVLVPLTGGMPRPFLDTGYSTPSWSPDNDHLVHIASSTPGDPLSIADRTGADARPIVVHDQGDEAFVRRGVHTHNPVWSLDGQWIYFVHGPDPFGEMDVWREHPSGQSLEQLTHLHAPVNFLAPLDLRTLLYVARAEDWSGPWLWALDVESKVARRVTVGLEQYTSVSASRDGRRVVATVANPTASLWRVPLLDRLVDDRDEQPYPVQTERALAPRFGGTSLFYLSLSARGNGDGLWRFQNGRAFEVRKGAEGVLSEPPAASPDGSRVAVVVRQEGKRHLVIMSADGTNSRTLAASIDIQGVVGQGTADWSPDGAWIVTGGSDEHGPGLFKIPVDGGAPVRLFEGEARSPVWSPNGDLIVYATPFGRAGGVDALRGMRPDGTPVRLPEIGVRLGGAHRFLRSGAGLVYLEGIESKDFWQVDLATNKLRQLTDFSDRGYLNTFDITPDGKYLVFDRLRQNSDVVLIDRPK